ncbi:MAG: arginase [Bacteroidia bacterium]|nr:arginase [Bacteroidia bacterium]
MIKSELGAGTIGASLGVDAIKLAALKKKSDIFLTHTSESIESSEEWAHIPVKHEFAKRIEEIIIMYERISDKVRSFLSNGRFPFIIAGDQANAGGTIAGIKRAYPKARLGVIWIDAHADIHSPYTTPSGNIHGMPLAASLNLKNLDSKVRDLDPHTEELWDRLCKVGGIYPKIYSEDLILIDIRDLEDPEWDVIERENIEYYEPEDILSMGAEKVAEEALEYLHHCDFIYVSFDVDSLDTSISTGTGTPVPNGLTLLQPKALLKRLWKSPKLIAFEIVEVNPLLDTQNKMAEIAFEIIQELVEEPYD